MSGVNLPELEAMVRRQRPLHIHARLVSDLSGHGPYGSAIDPSRKDKPGSHEGTHAETYPARFKVSAPGGDLVYTREFAADFWQRI